MSPGWIAAEKTAQNYTYSKLLQTRQQITLRVTEDHVIYQAVSNIEDDVDSVQAVADVLPEWGDHNHRLSARPGQVIVVVTLKDDKYKNLMLNVSSVNGQVIQQLPCSPSNTAQLYWVVEASGLQVVSNLLP